jgi:hypothetical protein
MFDLFRRLKAGVSAEFRRRYAEARAQSGAKAQPSPLAAALDQFFGSEPFRAAIAEIIKGSFEDGVRAERERIAAAWAVSERDAVNRPTDSIFH